MKIDRFDAPRTFTVGAAGDVTISHCADVALEPDEQVTFVTPSGTEFDVARKAWGYYATPSMNGRLHDHGLRAALVRNAERRVYLMLVEDGQEDGFREYLEAEAQTLVCWLDTDEAVEDALRRLEGK